MTPHRPDRSRTSLLAQVDWPRVARTAQRELRNREKHAPAISTFRWWARRPHSVMGALLEAAIEKFGPSLTISDPFSGGGTVAFEAARRGLRIYAQDLYPWPTYGLSTTLTRVSTGEFEQAANELLRQLDLLRVLYQRRDGRELSHIIRIRPTECASCSLPFFDLPSALLSVRSRSTDDDRAFFCCVACGAVSSRRKDIATFTCDRCARSQGTHRTTGQCPHCSTTAPVGVARRWAGHWVAVLVSEVHTDGTLPRTVLRQVQSGDPINGACEIEVPRALKARIADGVETRRLIAAGFASWRDLYTERQLRILIGALQALRTLKTTEAIKNQLALCVLGAAEMPAYITRWDRFNPKPFECLANHRYSCSTVAVESNVLATVGRGSLRLRLKSAAKAARWLHQAVKDAPVVVRKSIGSPGRRPKKWDVLVATGSSCQQILSSRSVNVVLTDPPYHDDVQYGELARLFHAWLSVYRPLQPIAENLEAVPNSRRPSERTFAQSIAACLGESHRTLYKDGVLLLTFHNKELVAWQALARALYDSGFTVNAIAAVHAENANDHCKRNVEALLHDLVIECVKRDQRTIRPKVMIRPRTATEKNLAAIGFALASAVETGHVDKLGKDYLSNLQRLRGRRRLIE